MAGEYRLRRKLGEGGFGAVYEAEHPVLKRRAAVKVLHRAARMDSDAVQRFISEAQAANQIRSRHIVDVFSFGTLADGRHFFVMDLLEGEPLDRHLERAKRLPVPTALQLLEPLVQALDAAHAAGVVHRDLKPQNIFLVWEPTGQTVPKLLDFGTAKLRTAGVQTITGTPVGTPLYMSPEQARGEKVDRRADVYALGVLCHELLTGQLPFSGDSTVAVLLAQLSTPPPPVSSVCADLAAALDAPILRMLEKQPDARQATAGAALLDLKHAAEAAGYVVPAGMPQLQKPPPQPTAPLVEFPGNVDLSSDYARARTTRPAGPTTLRGRSRMTLVVGLGVVLAATGAAVLSRRPWSPVAATGAGAGPPEEAVSAPAATAGGVPAPRPAPPTPTTVPLTLLGAPRGAQVLLAGKSIGEAPGPLDLPYGETAVELTIAAAGYESRQILVIPNQATQTNITLTRKPTAPKRTTIPTDLESPF